MVVPYPPYLPSNFFVYGFEGEGSWWAGKLDAGSVLQSGCLGIG